ncbi:MAG: Eco57I restriction-modification methylase domain-containing protein [Clostridia bacterium]|nr:Eco57I restriction-modification methylase domain-containing protein [Clostridia bacterium]
MEIGAKIVTVVSAKADVKEEWKKTVESHIKFKKYKFYTADVLSNNENIIKETIKHGERVVVFLTLQDLQGETIKEKHKELFGSKIDLIIVDETHFGARAEKYGQVLRTAGYEKDFNNKKDTEDFIESSEADEQIKILDAKIKLHLSGTPYRILMGSEFSKEDIIAFYQFTDISNDQEAWIKENNRSDEPKEEWENPYYGFPQMIRFAFNPNESSRQRLKELRENGVSYAFSALFKPQSIRKSSDGSHKKFVYEKEILDLLEVIDGSKTDNELLGFLDYDRIKDGKMCRHIVMVLPYCASCDAIEALIKTNKEKFKNLSEYEIINISGVENPNQYKDSISIKNKITNCEKENKKTLTLTVNRMLTGSTVKEWDTMLFLKDTSSPQEYDQAIFRLQNQYIKDIPGNKGNIIKYNMKPQTLLVDFLPGRMFAMQEQKSQIYNVNVEEAGNTNLERRISEELRISPIIVMNSDKMEQVRAADILQAVSEYSKTRGVAEETEEIPVDLSLMDIETIRIAIEKENELGSKQGFTTKAHVGDNYGSDMDTPTDTGRNGEEPDNDSRDENTDTGTQTDQVDVNKKDPIKQFRSYYARILFFAFLTKDVVISLEDIIAKIDSDENKRIACHIGITKPVLEAILIGINKFILRDLDYKIQNLNHLSHDGTVDPIERANVAVRKFGKLGESEVITPKKICNDMVALIPDNGFIDAVANGHKILDIAGKAGEFALAVYERMKHLGIEDADIQNAIYTIPTSGITYEFTRMVYEILGLNVINIAEQFTSYNLLDIKDQSGKIDYKNIISMTAQAKPFNEIILNGAIAEGDEKMNFDVIVGNPPYQEIVSKATGNKSLGKQLFPSFIVLSTKLSDRFVTLITPSKWFTSEGQDGSFAPLREFAKANNHFKYIKNYNDNAPIFSGVALGAVNYFLYDKEYIGDVVFSTDHSECMRPLFEDGMDIILTIDQMVSIVKKVANYPGFRSLMDYTYGRDAFGIPGKKEILDARTSERHFNGSVSVRCAHEIIRYIAKSQITKNIDLVNRWKIFTSKGNGAAGTLEVGKANAIIGKAYVGSPDSACSDSLIPIGPFGTEEEVKNLVKYMATKFLRFMVGVMKASRNIYQVVYKFVPVQDFTSASTIDWSKSIDEIDAKLYEKYGLTTNEIAFIESTIKQMD